MSNKFHCYMVKTKKKKEKRVITDYDKYTLHSNIVTGNKDRWKF